MVTGLAVEDDLDRLADELLDQADELEPDVDDQAHDSSGDAGVIRRPSVSLFGTYRPRPPRRQVADPATRTDLLELVGVVVEAKLASELEDDDRAVAALERTARRADELAARLRTRLEALPLSEPDPSGDSPLRCSA